MSQLFSRQSICLIDVQSLLHKRHGVLFVFCFVSALFSNLWIGLT